MDRIRPSRPELEDLMPYDAKEVKAEVMLASNENPVNLPAELVARLAKRLPEFRFNRYPDPTARELRALIAEANGLETENVLLGNGGDELIFDLLLAWGGPGRTLLDMPPTFSMYGIDAQVTGTAVVSIPRLDDFSVDREAVLERLAQGDIDIVIVANPNNPTGGLTDESFLIDLLKATDALVLVDEAYFEFSRHTMRPHMTRHKNLVILRTFSKAFSMAGLRIGYVLGHEEVICELMKVRQPYSVDSFSQWVASAVFKERMVFEQGIRDLVRGRDQLMHGLSMLEEVTVFPSEANFVLFRVEHAAALWRDLLHNHSVLVRDFSRAEGLEDCLRVTVGTDEENRRFLEAMSDCLGHRKANTTLGRRRAAVTEGGTGHGTHREHLESDTRDRHHASPSTWMAEARRPSRRACRSSTTCSTPSAATGCSRWWSRAKGDLEIDAHHTVEDVGIVLGEAFAEALGDKVGITRFGSSVLPMDEALVLAAVDISGRGQLHWAVELPIEIIGTFDTTLAKEFLIALATNAGITLHVRSLAGDNAHHIIEAAFKAVARALKEAVAIDPRVAGVPSTKGSL